MVGWTGVTLCAKIPTSPNMYIVARLTKVFFD
jgi:hypothetical protein